MLYIHQISIYIPIYSIHTSNISTYVYMLLARLEYNFTIDPLIKRGVSMENLADISEPQVPHLEQKDS